MTTLIRIIGTIAFLFVVYLALRAVADVLFPNPSKNGRLRQRRLRSSSGADREANIERQQKAADHNGRG
ncbi:hypothetical protein OKW33_005318 [Paraburkholderia atlantica]